MRAMRMHRVMNIARGADPLREEVVDVPRPATDEVLVEVEFCGVCHTELDEIEGRTPPDEWPMTPGHQVVGRVVAIGPGADGGLLGQAVGVAWIHSACGECQWCTSGRENLCPDFRATGRDAPGGYAEYMTAPAAFVHPLPRALDPLAAAPLLCAGAVGWRALKACGLQDGAPLGLTGFGASAHLVIQFARRRFPESPVYVFARDEDARAYALELGAAWAGDTGDAPPDAPMAIIDTTPAWRPVLAALEVLAPGGRLVINAIRKEAGDQSALQDLDYEIHLWREKQVVSVANVTRRDVRECLDFAAQHGIRPQVTEHPLAQANEALRALKRGGSRGARVLRVSG